MGLAQRNHIIGFYRASPFHVAFFGYQHERLHACDNRVRINAASAMQAVSFAPMHNYVADFHFPTPVSAAARACRIVILIVSRILSANVAPCRMPRT